MARFGQFSLVLSGILFIAFFSNVAMGAFGQKPLLNDIQEMLTLLASSILFAVAVLRFEAKDAQNDA